MSTNKYTEGAVIENRHWTDTLYSLSVKADIQAFTAGQFGRLGLEIDGNLEARPYSFVNAPGEELLEFYSIIIPEGVLSPRLATLKPGDSVQVSIAGSGFLVLKEVPPADYLWMLSTGTALGPFLSILKTDEPWRRFKKIALIHAVRQEKELTYRDTINAIAEARGGQFVYVPFVSREKCDFALPGRIPAAIDNGSLAARADMPITAAESQVMICGNPDMVKDTTEVLEKAGLQKNRRRTPGHISVERYW